MNNKDDILQDIESVIKETKSFDFPFWASEKRKAEIIEEKKKYIEEQLKQLDPDSFPADIVLTQTWKEAVEHANLKFKSLPSKVKINGFYLQELISFYSEKLGQQMLNYTREV